MLQHRWDISAEEAIQLQRQLAGLVRQERLAQPVNTVAGTDCAIVTRSPTQGPAGRRRADCLVVAAAVLCDAESLKIIATASHVQPCHFPYVPGLLSFREAPAVIAAVGKLPARPDLLLCDAQGIAHPRRLGLAAHVGICVELPTIGVAKSRLCGTHRPVGRTRGCHVRLIDRGQAVGAVLRTQTGVTPLYVSVGNLITLAESIQWVLRCCRRYRLAEPNRQAHMLVTAMSRNPATFLPDAAKSQ